MATQLHNAHRMKHNGHRTTFATRVGIIACALLVYAVEARADVVFPRDAAAHIVAVPSTPLEQRMVGRLTDYLQRVLRKPPKVVTALDQVPPGAPAILLVSGDSPIRLPVSLPADSPEAFALATVDHEGRSIAAAVGTTDRGLKRAIHRLIIEGRQEPAAWVFPATKRTQQPWIPHREWTVCPWTPNAVRGVFANPRADRRMDITRYGGRQLADYAEMFDWFGYSGCQMMETAYSYAVFGSIEGFQNWQKRLAEAVRENGQDVSLWVWAAEFSGFGWYDPEVIALAAPKKGAFEDPATRRVFEKYYDHYARLAPLVDRVIGHFYDPGILADRADVFKYMRLLEEKFKAVNPSVQMAIDSWSTQPDYIRQLRDSGFADYLLLENGLPVAFKPGARAKLHEEAKANGLRLGLWGWYLTEYESDQMPSLYVNARLLKNLYQQIRKEAIAVHPVEYWSEMEAHHLNNIYSMYAAGQLLWNPDRDPEEILSELVLGIWGPVNGPLVLDAVKLIQDVRSGSSWETFWWGAPGYRIGTERPGEDLRRAETALSGLERMTRDADFVPKFPLPFPPETFAELMIPHLRQIKLYSEFRLALAAIRKAAGEGVAQQELQKMLDAAWKPVPEFTTWVGTFGSPEVRQQDRQMRALCDELKLKQNDPPWLHYLDADRVYQFIQSRERNRNQPFRFQPSNIGEFYWHPARVADRVQKLLEDGLIEKGPDGMLELRRPHPP